MPTAGRKPKPKAIKDATGRDHHGPQPAPAELDCDAGGTVELYASYDTIPDPRDMWDSLCKAGVVKISDRLAYMRYVDLFHVYVNALKDVKERGEILLKNTVNERYNPSWRIMRDAAAEILKLESEFGLTPSSKRRAFLIPEAAAKESDEYEQMRKAQRSARK